MNKYIESEKIELKEKYRETIVKEIVSFLNGDGGTIFVGVKDNGIVVGVNKSDEVLRKISDIITSQIEPNPQDEIKSEIKFDDEKAMILIEEARKLKNKAPNLYVQNIEMKYCNYLENKILK